MHSAQQVWFWQPPMEGDLIGIFNLEGALLPGGLPASSSSSQPRLLLTQNTPGGVGVGGCGAGQGGLGGGGPGRRLYGFRRDGVFFI